MMLARKIHSRRWLSLQQRPLEGLIQVVTQRGLAPRRSRSLDSIQAVTQRGGAPRRCKRLNGIQAVSTVVGGVLGLLMLSCGGDFATGGNDEEVEKWVWSLPQEIPEPVVPAENPMSVAKVQLGRMLFYDPALSANGEQACAGCHKQERAFAEERMVSEGSTGDAHPRNSQALVNIAYYTTLTWSNPLLVQIESQLLIPIFGDDPVELGILNEDDEEEVLSRFRASAEYRAAFAEAFPEEPNVVIDRVKIVQALASFVRSLVSFSSPYDRYVAGEKEALSASAIRGLDLFFSERLECFHCHGGFTFAGTSVHEGQPLIEKAYFNTGLYNVSREGGLAGEYPYPNRGLYDVTADRLDMGAFRPPSLRNVAVTGPYTHDGTVASLEEMLDIYARGGRLIEDGPNQGDGAENPLKSSFIRGFTLTDNEKEDVLNFLRSLTDTSFLEDPAHADPGIRALP